jgi:putative tricarboxylic transport membrane protein
MDVPRGILIPAVVVLSVVGTYAIQNSMTDVYWMLAFGVLGYFLKVYGFPIGPIILGVILGPLMDVSYRRAMLSSTNDPWNFLVSLVANPISAILTAFFVILLLSQTRMWQSFFNRKQRQSAETSN